MSHKMNSPKQDFLLVSLLQDLKCLDKILKHILTVKNFKLKSWLFPQKNIDECVDYYTHFYTGNVTYVKCLEMIIEKLYVFFNFLNQSKRKNMRNIEYPPRITLGRCVQIFWDSIRSEEEEIPLEKSCSSANVVINKECQTKSKSLNECDSCSEINQFMKNMIKFISENFQDSSTKNTLNNLNENIFSTTKFGGTLQFTNSIKEDYENLVNKLNEKNEENIKLKNNLNKYRLINDEKEKQLKEFNTLKHELTENLKNTENEIFFLNNKMKIIEKEKELLQQNCDNYVPILDDFTNQLKKLQEERIENKKEFESKMKNYENIIRNYEAECVDSHLNYEKLQKDFNQLRNKYSELFCKYSKMCKMNKIFEKNLDSIDDTIKNVNDLTEKTLNSVINTSDRTIELNEKIKLLKRNYEEEKIYTNSFYKVHKVSRQNERYITINIKLIIGTLQQRTEIQNNEAAKIQGNPLLDFKSQIEGNEELIKKLEAQNKKFESIVKIYQKSCNLKSNTD